MLSTGDLRVRVVHIWKLHLFPTENDNFGESDLKEREYKQKTTFNLNCSGYCKHEKL